MGKLLEKFPHTPSKLLHKCIPNMIRHCTDRQSTRGNPRFCSRELPGTAETLLAKKVVQNKITTNKMGD